MPTMAAARTARWRASAFGGAPAARRRPNESAIETPAMKRKKGKIVSVYVQPSHSAWSSGG